jgi:Zierdtviridae DNA polymerase
MKFSSLHHHTTFSYLDGYGTPERHIARAAELGMNSIAITDHGNVTGHVQFEKAAIEQGIHPVFGCELYCGETDHEERHQRKNHLTVLAENQTGYRNLLRIVTRGWDEGFYYEPTVNGSMLADNRDGLIILSGCTGSLLATSLIGGKLIDEKDASYQRGKRVAQKMRRFFGDNYYLEVQAFPELEKTVKLNGMISQLSKELKVPMVATMDCHYTKPEEGEIQAILHNMRPGEKRTFEDQIRSWGYDVPLTILKDNVIRDRLVDTGLTYAEAADAIGNSTLIADRCQVKLPQVDNLRFPLPPSLRSPEALFRQWLNDGWKYRQMNHLMDLRDQEGRNPIERVRYEMGLIESKGFTDYFLVVSDAVKYAKESGIPVGPARGSAAASLVCYLLRITEVNPLLFPTLIFERFIDINRHDLPDIDLDFDDERRWMVRDYLVNKYGAERVGNIGTFVRFKGRNSLDDVARVYGVPHDAVKEIKERLIERSSGDLRANATIEDTIEMFPQVKRIFDEFPDLYRALALEGNVKNMSIHAAGLVIANSPLTDFCAVYTRHEKDGSITQVVSLDKYDAEYLNVLKLDALGLKTMSMIRIALEEIGISLEELYATPLDDVDTIKGFQEGDVVGVFQFDGRAMRTVNSGVLPDNFSEVSDVNALARPGPLHSGATSHYIDIKFGRAEPVHYHPIVDRITQHTQYQVVYQEQILQIVRELGGFSWEEAARIRKIISKKRGEQEFNTQREKFVEGAASHGMKSANANKVFSMLATAGAYAFNAAHCISYGMLAFWTMWLKRNYPLPFYVAALRKYEDKRDELLRDAAKKEIEIRPLHFNRSNIGWTIDRETSSLRPGFEQVYGVGVKTASAILLHRNELKEKNGLGFKSNADIMSVRGIGPKTLDALYEFVNSNDPFQLTRLTNLLNEYRLKLAEGLDDGGPFQLPEPTHTAAEIPYERTDGDVAVVWLGAIRERNLKDLFELHHSRTGEVLDPGSVYRPELNEWVVMLGYDETDLLTVTVDRYRYKRFRDMAWNLHLNTSVVLIEGKKKGGQNRRAIYVDKMWVLND